MSMTLLAGLFLFIVAAVTAAGYVFVLRPASDEPGEPSPRGVGGELSSQQDLPAAQAAIAGIFQQIGEALPGSSDQLNLRRMLMAAGYRWPSAVPIFLGLRVGSSLLLGSAAAWASFARQTDIGAAFIACVAGLGIGYLIPDKVLGKMVQARAARLRRALPAALDLMVLSLEAGQGLDAAILDTSRGLRVTHPDLASEFVQLHLEMRTTTSRSEALKNFSERGRDPELRKFANLLLDTDRFGTSVGPALKTHAHYLRIRFRQKAQETARKVGVKLIFPVFFLIFPSVILVTLGPAVIMLMGQMGTMFGK
jgi:tight adherence protein C